MKNRFENTQERFGKLILQVILRIKRYVILQYKDRVFRSFEELISPCAFDYYIRDSISQRRGRTYN